MSIYDDYDELEDAEDDGDFDDDEWEEDDEEMVLVVTFNGSYKKYHYYTDDDTLSKGDKLRIRQYQNRETTVTVVGYSSTDAHASRKINIIEKIKPGRTNKFKEGNTNTMKKKTTKVVQSAKGAITEAKDVAIKFQKGSAVIVAVKTAINESELVPEKVKELVTAGNKISDLIIGLTLQVVAETFTDSEIIQEAAQTANFTGAVNASADFTMLQDMIEGVVGSAVQKINPKADDKSDVDENVGSDIPAGAETSGGNAKAEK